RSCARQSLPRRLRRVGRSLCSPRRKGRNAAMCSGDREADCFDGVFCRQRKGRQHLSVADIRTRPVMEAGNIWRAIEYIPVEGANELPATSGVYLSELRRRYEDVGDGLYLGAAVLPPIETGKVRLATERCFLQAVDVSLVGGERVFAAQF